jgi:hypothetical protein
MTTASVQKEHVRAETDQPRSRAGPRNYLLLLILLIAAVIRLSSLDADPPGWYIPLDIGFHVDDGYKTLDARNRIVFGKTHWNANDDYPGWSKSSPFTQQSYYYAFKILGLHLSSARLVNVCLFTVFLIVVMMTTRRHWNSNIVLFGAFLFAIDPTLFNFSRVTLFEIALILFIYTGILLLLSLKPHRHLAALLMLTGIALIAGLGIKLSALFYLLPVCAVVGIVWCVDKRFISTRNNGNLAMLVVLAFTLVAALFLTRDVWITRVTFGLSQRISAPQVIFWNNIAMLSPFLLTTAYLCIIHTVAERSALLMENLFRLALVASVVCLPIMLNLFAYNPPRYSAPIVPAAILLILDWLNRQQSVEHRIRSWSQLRRGEKLAVVGLLVMIVMSLLNIFNTYIVYPFDPRDKPGLSRDSVLMLFPFASIAAFLLMYKIRARIGDRQIRACITLSLLAYCLLSIGITARALIAPTYFSQAVRSKLEANIGSGQSVAGDWAPFLTAESTIPSLYMNREVNRTDTILKTRPDYLVLSEVKNDRFSLARLQKNTGLALDAPVFLGVYHSQDINLYRIHYLQD